MCGYCLAYPQRPGIRCAECGKGTCWECGGYAELDDDGCCKYLADCWVTVEASADDLMWWASYSGSKFGYPDSPPPGSFCPLCSKPTKDGYPHKECEAREQAIADGLVVYR